MELFENLFYIFGSWALIQLAYYAGFAAAQDESPNSESKWDVMKFLLLKIGLAIIAFFWFALLSGLGEAYEKRFLTLEGFAQAVIVIGTLAFFGVWKSIKRNKEIIKKNQESEERIVNRQKTK